MPRARSPVISSGSQRICIAASGRQLRPIARPAITPRSAPLASMRVADEWLAGETSPQLGEGFVVDRWQLADLERARSPLYDELLEGTHDSRVELDALVLGELVERALL